MKMLTERECYSQLQGKKVIKLKKEKEFLSQYREFRALIPLISF